jgi:predicted RNase H-like nuclease (RuvC/YqgF family)
MEPIPTLSTLVDIGGHPVSMGSRICENSAFPPFTLLPLNLKMNAKSNTLNTWGPRETRRLRTCNAVESQTAILTPKQENTMKSRIVFTMLLAFSMMLMLSCTSSEDAAESTTPEAVKKEVKEAAEAVATLTQQEMDSFVDQMESQLNTLETKADDLSSRAQTLQGEAKTAADKKIEILEEKREQARKRLKALKSSSAEAWEELKMGLQASMLRLNQALQEAAAAFN